MLGAKFKWFRLCGEYFERGPLAQRSLYRRRYEWSGVFRAAASGGRFASVAIDPAMGYLFNTGNAFGFGASLVQNSAGTIDVEFANLYAPTAVIATAATGGTLAAATYYATVTSTSDNCTHQS